MKSSKKSSSSTDAPLFPLPLNTALATAHPRTHRRGTAKDGISHRHVVMRMRTCGRVGHEAEWQKGKRHVSTTRLERASLENQLTVRTCGEARVEEDELVAFEARG